MSRAPHVIHALNAAVRVLNANRGSCEALTQVRNALRRAGEVGPWSDELDDRLVVYGTLAPGRPNHQVVAGIAGRWFTGWVEGDLYELGWGAADGYPAMVWRPGGRRIDVHVLESSELSRHWARLDGFEGVGYRRVLVPVFRDDAPPTVGRIYVARPNESGDA
ncbi:MAG: gamma-glutamylcyclotransferase [Chloroflexota bacterium]|nr:gamma-glutamylcyclotransferase [Chloroflexota bacterium]